MPFCVTVVICSCQNRMSKYTCFLCAVVGQNKYLKAKFGAVDDEMADDDKDEDEENKRVTWGSRKNAYMNADNVDFEVRSVVICLCSGSSKSHVLYETTSHTLFNLVQSDFEEPIK